MSNYYYVVRYLEDCNECPIYSTQRGTVAGNNLADAMKNLEAYYPDIERASLYRLKASDYGCLELSMLDEVRDDI